MTVEERVLKIEKIIKDNPPDRDGGKYSNLLFQQLTSMIIDSGLLNNVSYGIKDSRHTAYIPNLDIIGYGSDGDETALASLAKMIIIVANHQSLTDVIKNKSEFINPPSDVDYSGLSAEEKYNKMIGIIKWTVSPSSNKIIASRATSALNKLFEYGITANPVTCFIDGTSHISKINGLDLEGISDSNSRYSSNKRYAANRNLVSSMYLHYMQGDLWDYISPGFFFDPDSDNKDDSNGKHLNHQTKRKKTSSQLKVNKSLDGNNAEKEIIDKETFFAPVEINENDFDF